MREGERVGRRRASPRHFSSALHSSDVLETRYFLGQEEPHNETGPSLIGPFRPIKNEVPLPRGAIARNRSEITPVVPDGVSRTSLNPENVRRSYPRAPRTSFSSSSSSSPSFANKLDHLTKLTRTSRANEQTDRDVVHLQMSKRREREREERDSARGGFLLRSPLHPRWCSTVCYFIPRSPPASSHIARILRDGRCRL